VLRGPLTTGEPTADLDPFWICGSQTLLRDYTASGGRNGEHRRRRRGSRTLLGGALDLREEPTSGSEQLGFPWMPIHHFLAFIQNL